MWASYLFTLLLTLYFIIQIHGQFRWVVFLYSCKNAGISGIRSHSFSRSFTSIKKSFNTNGTCSRKATYSRLDFIVHTFFIDLILISFSRTNVCVTWCVFNIPLVWFHLNSWDRSYSVMQSHGMLVFTSTLAFLSREIINKCVKYGANFEVRRVQADSSTQNAEHQ